MPLPIRMFRFGLALLAFCLVSTVSVPMPAAAVVVLESNVPGLKKGARLSDRTIIRVPAGKSVRLLLSSGATRRIKGPYHGSVGAGAPPTAAGTARDVTGRFVKGGRREGTIGVTPRVVDPPGKTSTPRAPRPGKRL